ncbi:hypothetical protein [Parasphingopyxis marina]|uniref:HEAT repeat domain-containing protein n=1 Tax=Parasphingopyxis marina TaxID=2761622 RepID=A0A842I029_9SPHN|nr:hypothetical protein [Parasphingopyxis marina]MBC2777114.1 hypothetical protein [Parasphingopyxis marina]
MQPGEALRRWLSDAGEHRAALDRTATARAAFETLPPVARFRDRVAGSQDVDAIAEALRDLFEAPVWVTAAVDAWIGGARRDPFFAPPFRPVSGPFHQGALLIELAEATVAVSIVDPVTLAAHKRAGGGRGSVHFTGRRTWLKFLDGGGMRLAFWRAPEASEDVAALSRRPCKRVEVRDIETGDGIAVDTRSTSYIIESAKRPAVFLHGEVRMGGAALAREYDAATRRLIGVSSSSDRWSRIQMMLSWLRRIGHLRAGEMLGAAIRDAPFFVRWHAMREWLACDPAGAMPELERMARDDPHKEVREAAGKTLAVLAGRRAA